MYDYVRSIIRESTTRIIHTVQLVRSYLRYELVEYYVRTTYCSSCTSTASFIFVLPEGTDTAMVLAPGSATSGGGSGAPPPSLAVDRSAELLSCARAALRIGQERSQRLGGGGEEGGAGSDGGGPELPAELLGLPPSALSLHPSAGGGGREGPGGDVWGGGGGAGAEEEEEEGAGQILTSDALRLLGALDAATATLSGLVRRRGHTNDPTARIGSTVRQFQEMAKEVARLVGQVKAEGAVPVPVPAADGEGRGGAARHRPSRHRKAHYEKVAEDLNSMAKERTDRVKKMMEVRESVIRDQNRRRKLLNPSTAPGSAPGAGTAASAAATSSVVAKASATAAAAPFKAAAVAGTRGLTSPLFTMTEGAAPGGAGTAKPRPPPPPAQPSPCAGSTAATGPASSTAPAAVVPARSGPRPPPPARQQQQQQHYSAGGYATTAAAGPGAAHQGATAASSASASAGGVQGRTDAAATGGAQGYGGGYGGGYGCYRGSTYGGGYGGGGMRRRPNAAATGAYHPYSQQHRQQAYDPAMVDDNSKKTDGDDVSAVQSAIQARRARRETQSRMESARAAERSLAELGTMFTKMADLVSMQAETVTTIEDDVEAAQIDVHAGQEEIQKLYGITKGNRGLIIKVFGILIFFIVFMRFY